MQNRNISSSLGLHKNYHCVLPLLLVPNQTAKIHTELKIYYKIQNILLLLLLPLQPSHVVVQIRKILQNLEYNTESKPFFLFNLVLLHWICVYIQKQYYKNSNILYKLKLDYLDPLATLCKSSCSDYSSLDCCICLYLRLLIPSRW